MGLAVILADLDARGAASVRTGLPHGGTAELRIPFVHRPTGLSLSTTCLSLLSM